MKEDSPRRGDVNVLALVAAKEKRMAFGVLDRGGQLSRNPVPQSKPPKSLFSVFAAERADTGGRARSCAKSLDNQREAPWQSLAGRL